MVLIMVVVVLCCLGGSAVALYVVNQRFCIDDCPGRLPPRLPPSPPPTCQTTGPVVSCFVYRFEAP
jgi:hypothetical protein